MTSENRALLDFDGFICKSYYAMLSKESTDFDEMLALLEELVEAAISKMPEGTDVLKYISGHTYKKDIYPSYKANRKRDEVLGEYRDFIKLYYDGQLIKSPILEADDLIVMDYEHYTQEGFNVVVFSDDKDLRYYCKKYCKINLNEEIVEQKLDEMYINRIVQFIAGDREDGVQGIYGLGEKKALKELERLGGINTRNVIKLYKEKGISIDECLKNIILISPLHEMVVEDYEWSPEDDMKNILGHFRYWKDVVEEVYYKTI